MDALLAVLVPILPQLGGGGLLLVFTVWRERAHNVEVERWKQEVERWGRERAALLAEKAAAVKAERDARAEDDERRERRIAALVEENEALEKRLDDEREARRQAQDGTVQLPLHRLRDGGTAS